MYLPPQKIRKILHVANCTQDRRNSMRSYRSLTWSYYCSETKSSPFFYTFQYICDVRYDFWIQPRWHSADSIEKYFDL